MIIDLASISSFLEYMDQHQNRLPAEGFASFSSPALARQFRFHCLLPAADQLKGILLEDLWPSSLDPQCPPAGDCNKECQHTSWKQVRKTVFRRSQTLSQICSTRDRYGGLQSKTGAAIPNFANFSLQISTSHRLCCLETAQAASGRWKAAYTLYAFCRAGLPLQRPLAPGSQTQQKSICEKLSLTSLSASMFLS